MTIREELFALQDKEYAAFQAKLTPGVPIEAFIGCRVPELRKLAKKIQKTKECQEFLHSLPHEYYDENVLHSILLADIKPFMKAIEEVERFIPYIDNWAVCDVLKPKVFKKNTEQLIPYIKKWAASKETYTCRIGIEFLMNFYLDENFLPEYLEIPAVVRSEEYYVNMMVAWFFATALAKQWEKTIPYLETQRMDDWTHNKTIQKARESFRITPEQKEYLKGLKV